MTHYSVVTTDGDVVHIEADYIATTEAGDLELRIVEEGLAAIFSADNWAHVQATPQKIKLRREAPDLVEAIDAIDSGDPERAHAELDDLLAAQFSDKVNAAISRLKSRCGWWAAA